MNSKEGANVCSSPFLSTSVRLTVPAETTLGVVIRIVVSFTTVPVTAPSWPNSTVISLDTTTPVDFVAYLNTSVVASLKGTCMTPFPSMNIEFPSPTSPLLAIVLIFQSEIPGS